MPRQSVQSISEVQRALNRRFFLAIDALVQQRRIRSLSGFVAQCGLHPPRYREMRAVYGSDVLSPAAASRYVAIESEALYNLVVRHKVSAHWLLTGEGQMFLTATDR